jgi:hypothetical protein
MRQRYGISWRVGQREAVDGRGWFARVTGMGAVGIRFPYKESGARTGSAFCLWGSRGVVPNLLRLGIGDRRGKGKAALRLLSGLKVFGRACIQTKGDHKGGGLVGVLRVPAGAFELVACRGSCAWRREEKD